jgi:hypothetical protein
MPNGVICGGAVDGSNQAGEIVTCQAKTARPAGAASAESAAVSEAKNAPRREPTKAAQAAHRRDASIKSISSDRTQ